MVCTRFGYLSIVHFFWFACIFVEMALAYYPPMDMSRIDPLNITHEEIGNALRVYGIIPDILASVPPFFAKVTFLSYLCPRLGQELEPHQMRFPPTKIEWAGRSDEYFTLLAIDPDAPSKAAPYEREYLHWMVVNVRGGIYRPGSETVVDYMSPEPLIGTGLHRYVFLVLLQPEEIDFKEGFIRAVRGDSRRASFSSRIFARHYELTFFAINFFRAAWHERVVHHNYSHTGYNRKYQNRPRH